MLLMGLPAAALAADDFSAVQQSAIELERVRGESARLQLEWEGERGLLEATRSALRERVRELEEQRDLAAARTATARRGVEDAAEHGRTLQEGLAAAQSRLLALGERVKAQQRFLPPRLASALERPLRRLGEPELSLGERAQVLTTLLNRWIAFDSAVTPAEEILTIDNERRHFDVLYFGTAQAYALDRTGSRAYLGRPSSSGWRWDEMPGQAAVVAQALAVARDESDPRFIELPAQLAAASIAEVSP